jgi:hypothetical protein
MVRRHLVSSSTGAVRTKKKPAPPFGDAGFLLPGPEPLGGYGRLVKFGTCSTGWRMRPGPGRPAVAFTESLLLAGMQ